MLLSVIIPNYNEERTIKKIIYKVYEQKKFINLEILVVDDFSSDKSKEILNKLKSEGKIDHLILQEKNYGKGFAIQTALRVCSGETIIIQDADLEYNPEDYKKLIDPIIQYKADVVYGSRFKGSEPKRIIYFSNRVANFVLSLCVSILKLGC